MATKTTNGKTKARGSKKEVTFEYFAPQAKQVVVAGTFNDWNPSDIKLKKDRSGSWKISLPLQPGRYEYRYVVDGTWQNDQRPVRCVPNGLGAQNCVLEVPADK